MLMNQEGYSVRYCNGISAKEKSEAAKAATRLENLPIDIHKMIFAHYLTFHEARVCLTLSRSIRSAVLHKRGWGHSLSNDSRYKLSQILPRYHAVLRGGRIRNLKLTTSHLPSTQEDREQATSELQKLMRILANQLCFSINKAIFHMYCISDEKWLNRFADIASTSLTDLSMQTSIAPSQILRAIQYILIRFSRLQSLSFGTHYYILKSNGIGSKNRLETIQESGVTITDPDNHIYAAPEAWAKKKFLCLTSFKVESNVDAKLLGMAVFRSMPNLERFSCRGNLFSMNTEEEIFVTLVRQCPSLDFISIEQNRNPCIKTEMAINIFTQQRRNSLREFRIVGHGGCKKTDRYIKAILKLTKDSLCCAQIGSPDCEYLFFMAGWEFPLLKYFISRCNYREAGNIPICIGHPDLCGVHLLRRFKYLHEVELRFMQVNMSALKQLEELKYLTLMVLDNCFGVPSEDELYGIRYRVWIKKY